MIKQHTIIPEGIMIRWPGILRIVWRVWERDCIQSFDIMRSILLNFNNILYDIFFKMNNLVIWIESFYFNTEQYVNSYYSISYINVLIMCFV